MAESDVIHVAHLSDTRHPDGAPVPAPFDVWDQAASLMMPPKSRRDRSRPPRYRHTVAIRPDQLRRHARPEKHRGALGTVTESTVPVKVDEWGGKVGWVTVWSPELDA